MDLKDGCPNCKQNNFEEIIDKGIVQKITYKEGHIVEEKTTYRTDKGKIKCLNCDFKTEEDYEL